ncbi:MAG: DMT family transporter [Gammaproteobacteria bacterium]|nr:DMT family transporter [Gammaproteobacteria bacterium]
MFELPQNSTIYAVTMLFAGVGIPVMAALNAGLGTRLQSPALAAAVLFLVAMVASLSYLLLVEGIPTSFSAPSTPFYFYLGGLFVVFYVLSVTWIAPRFGIGNAVSFVLLGQLLSMATIDQFGLLGAPQTTLTLPRLIGLLFMAIGVFLMVRK